MDEVRADRCGRPSGRAAVRRRLPWRARMRVNAARAFGAALDLTGVILTKADGDARGGAALSVRQVTGKPIVFLGVGEKTEALEPFDPERMASRILGMGDVVSLVEQVHRQVDHDEAAAPRPQGGQGQGLRHGGPQEPARAAAEDGRRRRAHGQAAGRRDGQKGAVSADQGDRDVRRQIAIINSMTRAGAAQPRHHRRLAAPAHRRGLGGAGSGRQPAAEAVPGDAADDEEHEGREAAALAGRLQGRPAARVSGPLGRPTKASDRSTAATALGIACCVESALFFGVPVPQEPSGNHRERYEPW